MRKKIDSRKPWPTGRWPIAFLGALIVVLGGCVAVQHRADMDKVHYVARTGSMDQALAMLEKRVLGKPGGDGRSVIERDAHVIDLLEIGALYHYAGRHEASNEALEIVYAHYADEEMKAHISVSNIAAGTLKSVFSEGMAGAYKLSGYEKVYLHTLKTLNYLMLGDLDAARVEVRRGEHQHKRIEDTLAANRAKAESDRRRNKSLDDLPDAQKNASRDGFFEAANLTEEERALIGGMKDGYRNAMTYNLSSIVYEANRERGDALLDLSKSYGLHSNPAVGDRFVRLAVGLGRTGDRRMRGLYRRIRKEYPKIHRAARNRPRQRSNVHVFLHTGDSPRVHALDIHIPNPVSGGVSKISLPRYRSTPDRDYRLEVGYGKRRGPAGVQLDFDRLAFKSFDDKLPGIYLRAITRLVVNTVADKEINERMGVMGQLFSMVKNEVIEQADTRSWTALPKLIHYANLRAGGREVEVAVKDQAGTRIFHEKFPVEKGKLTMVNIRKLGERFVARHNLVQLRSSFDTPKCDRSFPCMRPQ